MPVCSNCGAEEFVWVDSLRTGTIGIGTLSIRSGGALSLGTRICRACGHADLFLKDPAILRQPHTWREGEFVPIPSRSSPPARGSAPPSPPPSPPTPAFAPVASAAPSAPAPPPAPPEPGPALTSPPAAAAPPPSEAPAEEPLEERATASPARRPTRRRSSSKAKSDTPPLTHD